MGNGSASSPVGSPPSGFNFSSGNSGDGGGCGCIIAIIVLIGIIILLLRELLTTMKWNGFGHRCAASKPLISGRYTKEMFIYDACNKP